MKPLLSLLLISFLSSSLLCAGEPKELPDFSKAFPTEKLFNQTKLGRIESYGYATDLAFGDLKKKFREYLGKGWSEAEVDHEIEQSTNEAMKQQGMTMEGNTLFTNPAFPGVQIGLTQVKMALEGKKFLANITVIRNKAEDGAGQPAAPAEPDLEAADKPQQ